MKKVLLLIILSLLFIPSVKALEITIENNIKYESNLLKVSGTSQEANVQVAVFDGEDMIVYGVADVVSGEYNYTSPKISLTTGKSYTIKVASVDGSVVKTKQVTIGSNVTNPQTGDGILTSIIIGIISVIGICSILVFTKRKHKNI